MDPIDPNETWCSIKTDSAGVHVNGIGNYGFCSNDCNQCKDSQLTLQLDNGPSCKSEFFSLTVM